MTRFPLRPIVAAWLLAVFAACDADSGDPGREAPPAPDAPPTFRVDPTWPRELPNDWILGSITSVFVDDRDHVWITHLPETLTPEEIAAVQDPPLGECCVPAPVVIEIDPDGNVVQAWGRPRHAGCLGVPAQLARPLHRSQRLRVDRDVPPPPHHEVHPRRSAPHDARPV